MWRQTCICCHYCRADYDAHDIWHSLSVPSSWVAYIVLLFLTRSPKDSTNIAASLIKNQLVVTYSPTWCFFLSHCYNSACICNLEHTVAALASLYQIYYHVNLMLKHRLDARCDLLSYKWNICGCVLIISIKPTSFSVYNKFVNNYRTICPCIICEYTASQIDALF